MDTLDLKYYEPDLLEVEYDDRTNQNYEQNLETATPSSEELDQELESLLLLMSESNTGIQDESTPVYDDVVDPTVDEIEWLDPDELVNPKEFNYQPTPTDRSKYDQVPTCSSNRFNYQARRDSSISNNYNYSPERQADSKFRYQSDQGSSSKFDYQPTTSQTKDDRFDYKVPSRDFNYQSNRSNQFDYKPTAKEYPSTPHSRSNNQDRNRAVLDVEVDQNTTVRLEVGASVSVGEGYAHSAAYAKATIYRRG
ncbi:MAG: hypothetical protein AAFO04_19340 [Cyanobacteria bacterium J06592_8]